MYWPWEKLVVENSMFHPIWTWCLSAAAVAAQPATMAVTGAEQVRTPALFPTVMV